MKWLAKVNNIAMESLTVFRQLGRIVPNKLIGAAEIWYWSLPLDYHASIEVNWDTLKEAIVAFYINRTWLDKQKSKANQAYYREANHRSETPGEYFICKTELLTMVYTMDDSVLIMEVMEGAPTTWNTVLTTQLYRNRVEFQQAIQFHEDTLMKLDSLRHFENKREHPSAHGPKHKAASRRALGRRSLAVHQIRDLGVFPCPSCACSRMGRLHPVPAPL
jgi:hypothetical protein